MKRVSLFSLIMCLCAFSFVYGQNKKDTTDEMTGSSSRMKKPAAQMSQMILDRENDIMEAVKSKDIDKFKSNLADDFIGIYDMGFTDKDEEVQSLNDISLKNFSMSDQKVVFPTDDVAIVTYKAKETGSYKGKEFSDTYNVTSTWVRKNGKWLGVSHAEVKVPENQNK